MAQTDQRLIGILDRLPFCALCYQDLLQITQPRQPPCRHLFCTRCVDQHCSSSYFACPLDDMRAPANVVICNEHLVSLKEDFVSGLDAIEKEGEDDLLIECLEDIVAVMQAEVRTDLVKCRNAPCSKQDCVYAHPTDLSGLKRSVPFPLSGSYFEVNEPEAKCADYDIVEGDSEDEGYEDLDCSVRGEVVG